MVRLYLSIVRKSLACHFNDISMSMPAQNTASLVEGDSHGIGWSATHFDIIIHANRAYWKANPSILVDSVGLTGDPLTTSQVDIELKRIRLPTRKFHVFRHIPNPQN